jgi:hypothetical protein
MLGRKKKLKSKPKTLLGKLWYFIWEDNSIWSWLLNIVLAFVLIKFVVYPGLGFVLGTTHPVVAVVSNSMQHSTGNFDTWWDKAGNFYEDYDINKSDFNDFTLHGGFSKGDIIILRGAEPQSLKAGDIIVFFGSEPDPIIHRVVERWEEDGQFYFRTKGDNNPGFVNDELRINQNLVIGKAWFRLPLLGYVKIIFMKIIGLMGVG